MSACRVEHVTSVRMPTMEVNVEHFLDAGEQDANGDWAYFYEGDLFTFTDDSRSRESTLKARIYSDTPAEASFIVHRETLRMSPLTDAAVVYLRRRGAMRIKCLEPAGGYGQYWPAE